ncbi:hypothetical protein F66182_2253 [Fusarium sp. NRRL 66182]|nr:hypothetical protein F66182_2253 [Fusarium sp. NRRL 66182]
MESLSPQQSSKAVSAVDGLLASLLYFDETQRLTRQKPGIDLSTAQSLKLWGSIHHIWIDLERYCERLTRAVHTLNLSGCDMVLDSFANPTRFYEAAVFTFRNTLTGLTPDSLGNIFALCSLSYVASCYLSDSDNTLVMHANSPHVEHWRNAIRSREHRQAFSDLIASLWPEAPPTPYSIPDPSIVSQDVTYYEDEYADLLNEPWNPDDTMPDLFGEDMPQFTSQAQQSNHAHAESAQPAGPEVPDLQDLQRTAVITNLTCFLEGCGELMHILSGCGVTAKGLPSYVTFYQNGTDVKEHIKSLCIQPLRESLQDVSTLGILSIVDRFVELGYLQTLDEVKGYMMCVGKAGYLL